MRREGGGGTAGQWYDTRTCTPYRAHERTVYSRESTWNMCYWDILQTWYNFWKKKTKKASAILNGINILQNLEKSTSFLLFPRLGAGEFACVRIDLNRVEPMCHLLAGQKVEDLCYLAKAPEQQRYPWNYNTCPCSSSSFTASCI